MPFEELRREYQPTSIQHLFIGESRPIGNTFFYCENSNLYNSTKKAFENAYPIKFDCKVFRNKGYWLYDVCSQPVNNLTNQQRNNAIRVGLYDLQSFLQISKPKKLIVIKLGSFKTILKPGLEELGYTENRNLFFLPFPIP